LGRVVYRLGVLDFWTNTAGPKTFQPQATRSTAHCDRIHMYRAY